MPGLIVDPSDKQKELVAAILDPDCLHVVGSGPKRAGKSYPGNWAWMRYVNMAFRGTDFGLTTASQSRIEATFHELENICIDLRIPFRRRTLYAEFGHANRMYHWVSKHFKSYEMIAGHTWGGCILDEGSRLQPECVREANIRCSLDHSKLLYTTNPKHEAHPFKMHVMDPIEAGERRGKVLFFGIDDNPALSTQKKQDMYDGLKHDPAALARDYYGKWVSPGGRMFPTAGRWVAKPPRPKTEMPYLYNVSIDPAPAAVTHALLVGEYSRGRQWVIAEWRHDGRTAKGGQMEYPDQTEAIVSWATALAGDVRIARWRSDPADPTFRDSLRAAGHAAGETGNFDSFKKPDLRPSIAAVNSVGGRTLWIAPQCPLLMGELNSLGYDERAMTEYGIEKPDDGNDDAADSLRYHVWDSSMWRTSSWI